MPGYDIERSIVLAVDPVLPLVSHLHIPLLVKILVGRCRIHKISFIR